MFLDLLHTQQQKNRAIYNINLHSFRPEKELDFGQQFSTSSLLEVDDVAKNHQSQKQKAQDENADENAVDLRDPTVVSRLLLFEREIIAACIVVAAAAACLLAARRLVWLRACRRRCRTEETGHF